MCVLVNTNEERERERTRSIRVRYDGIRRRREREKEIEKGEQKNNVEKNSNCVYQAVAARPQTHKHIYT